MDFIMVQGSTRQSAIVTRLKLLIYTKKGNKALTWNRRTNDRHVTGQVWCSTNWSAKPLTLLSPVAQSYNLKAQMIWGLKRGLMAFLYFSYLYPFRLDIIDGNIDSGKISEIEWIFHFACVIIILLLKFYGTWLSRMISSVGPASWTINMEALTALLWHLRRKQGYFTFLRNVMM